jgi:hypothetical protein
MRADERVLEDSREHPFLQAGEAVSSGTFIGSGQDRNYPSDGLQSVVPAAFLNAKPRTLDQIRSSGKKVKFIYILMYTK